MKAKLALLALSIALSSPVVLAVEMNQQSPNTTTATSQSLTNPATLEWLIVLNKNEIAAAKEVLKRKPLNPLVQQYAQFMVTQHTQLLQETLKLSKKMKETPTPSDNASNLQKQGQDALTNLQSLDAKAIQKPYIDAMVQGHTEALAAIKDYINNETNPAVKNLLKNTEKHVAMHLEKAKAIQKKLSM